MKKILMALCFMSTMILANDTHAYMCTMANCATTLAGDAGHTSKKCTSTSAIDGCACSPIKTGYCATKTVAIGSSCGTNYTVYGNLIGGVNKCCVSNNPLECPKNAEESSSTEEITTSNVDLANAFETDMSGSRATAYYGYIDATNRSPSNGRTTDPVAKLDACLDHGDVDTIDATAGTAADKWAACVGSTIGCGTTLKNEYCRATGLNDGISVSAAVCKDRCDCIYGQGTCGGN